MYAGNSIAFKPGTKPAVTLTSVNYNGDDQTSMSWTYKANLTNAGTPTITKRGFVVGSTNNPTLRPGQYDYDADVSGTSTGEFTRNDSWSGINKKYYVRAYAINAIDTVYSSNVLSYITHTYPSVTLNSSYSNAYYYSANVTTNSIKMNHSYSTISSSSTSGGCSAIHSQGLVYSTSPMSITDANTSATGINSSTAPSSFGTVVTNNGGGTYTISGLSSNTKYYIRAWARSAAGYTYSTEYAVRTKMNCGSTLYDQNGNAYSTVTIGSQCWMKSNLKATNYDNSLYQNEYNTGTAISYGGSSSSTSTRYYYYPGSNSSNVSGYGLLYNQPATRGSGVSYSGYSSYGYTVAANSQGKVQGVCPRGWHIPTQSEWNTLNSKIESNFSAFSLQWAGYFSGATTHAFNNNYAEYWSCTLHSNGTDYYYWWYDNSSHNHTISYEEPEIGKSVRCIQD
jgi:uncharacterized protein (TIGR02145 family)